MYVPLESHSGRRECSRGVADADTAPHMARRPGHPLASPIAPSSPPMQLARTPAPGSIGGSARAANADERTRLLGRFDARGEHHGHRLSLKGISSLCIGRLSAAAWNGCDLPEASACPLVSSTRTTSGTAASCAGRR